MLRHLVTWYSSSIRDENNEDRKALKLLRPNYLPRGKPKVIALYNELTLLEKTPDETITDYMIRTENATTYLKNAEETIIDGLLIAVTIKGLQGEYKSFTAVLKRPYDVKNSKPALRNF